MSIHHMAVIYCEDMALELVCQVGWYKKSIKFGFVFEDNPVYTPAQDKYSRKSAGKLYIESGT